MRSSVKSISLKKKKKKIYISILSNSINHLNSEKYLVQTKWVPKKYKLFCFNEGVIWGEERQEVGIILHWWTAPEIKCVHYLRGKCSSGGAIQSFAALLKIRASEWMALNLGHMAAERNGDNSVETYLFSPFFFLSLLFLPPPDTSSEPGTLVSFGLPFRNLRAGSGSFVAWFFTHVDFITSRRLSVL